MSRSVSVYLPAARKHTQYLRSVSVYGTLWAVSVYGTLGQSQATVPYGQSQSTVPYGSAYGSEFGDELNLLVVILFVSADTSHEHGD